MSVILSLALIAQVGAAPPLHLPTGLEDRKPRRPPAAAAPPPPELPRSRTPLEECLSAVNSDPTGAVDMAEAWLEKVKGSSAAPAQLCLGSAKEAQSKFDEAETAYLAGRDAAAASDYRLRAQLGAQAGTMALYQEQSARALTALDQAHADALAAPDAELAGTIQIDRSRALVALKREADAVAALAEARRDAAQNPEGWLLSATLSRRQGKLAEAQTQIETAAQLDPRSAEIGLEAGAIAIRSGRDAAARKSWESVVAAAPDSEAAKLAKSYLAQLDELAKPAPAAPPAASAK